MVKIFLMKPWGV